MRDKEFESQQCGWNIGAANQNTSSLTSSIRKVFQFEYKFASYKVVQDGLLSRIANLLLRCMGARRYALLTLQGLFFLLLNLFISNAQADWEYYWWNQRGFNCLGPGSPGGPSFHTNSLQGTISLTVQKSIETTLSNPVYCGIIISLAPSSSPFFDESNAQYLWAIPVHGQFMYGSSYRYFDDLIRLGGTGDNPKNAGLTCSSVGNPINPGVGNKFDRSDDYAENSKYGKLSFERIYNSKSLYTLQNIGWGWTHNFSAHQAISPSGKSITMARYDGKIFVFKYVGSSWLPDTDISDRLDELKDSASVRIGWRYTTADNSIETYNVTGQLTSIVDRTGLTQTLTYSDASTPVAIAPTTGLLIRVTDIFGRQLNFTYDSSSRISNLTDPAGGLYKYAYDANNNLASVTYPDANSKIYLYENTGFPHALTGITDENALRYATYGYDTQGRATSTEHAGGVERVSLVYNADGSTTVTDALNTPRTYNFQTILGVVKGAGQSQPGGSGCSAASSNIAYDANGNVASRTDFNGTKSCYAYDLNRNLETVRIEGLPGTADCAASLTAASLTAPARKITTSWHASYRLPLQIAEPKKLTTYNYDPAGNALTQSEQATTDVTGTAGLTPLVQGSPRTWTYTYNNLGQVLTADGPRSDVVDKTTYTYYPATDANLGNRGNLYTVTNALSQVTTLSNYDANGRVGTITAPSTLVTNLAYYPRGWLKTLTLSYGTYVETTQYTYYPTGLLQTVTQPDNSVLTYGYDAAHRLTSVTDSLGNKVSYTLDNAGNRLNEQAADIDNILRRNITRVYDALNRLQTVTGAVQ
jgi:YD repeat-containing protein